MPASKIVDRGAQAACRVRGMVGVARHPQLTFLDLVTVHASWHHRPHVVIASVWCLRWRYHLRQQKALPTLAAHDFDDVAQQDVVEIAVRVAGAGSRFQWRRATLLQNAVDFRTRSRDWHSV